MTDGRVCSACGLENEPLARFCVACGAGLPSEPPVRSETRRVVTVLYSDVVGFTGIGHELDPESLRGLMGRYFERVQTIVDRHGGTTEKFIGDAVVAVFGVPQLHEDDAHRAVRAAVEIRDARADLNNEFRRDWGVELRIRTGVNTGEVVADSRSSPATPSTSQPASSRLPLPMRSSSARRRTGLSATR